MLRGYLLFRGLLLLRSDREEEMVMNRKLLVSFAGICAFKPDQPFFTGYEPGNPRKLSVLLPDLLQPALASWCLKTPERPVFRASHLAAITFSMRDYRAKCSTIEPDFVYDDLGIVLLKGDEIRLRRIATRKLTFESQVSRAKKPSPWDERSLWWLPRLAELTKETSTGTEQKAAEILIAAGHLSVDDFNENAKGKPRVWSFCRIKKQDDAYVCYGEPAIERAIGNRIGLRAKLEGEVAEIDFRRQGGNRQYLLLGKKRSKKTLRIAIVNAELESLLDVKGAPFVRLGNKNRGDADFESYYRFFDLDPGPVPAVTDNGAGDVARPCSPAAG